jgi:superfamily II DNA or RNA helicase
MSGFEVSPGSLIQRLRHNLDGYQLGVPMLSEFLQNADDADDATTLRLAIAKRPVAPESNDHPLFGEPALFVLNDGDFTAEHARGIRQLDVSPKAGKTDRVGRFGLGLKSVFHVCEAFFFFWRESEGAEWKVGYLNPWHGFRRPAWDEAWKKDGTEATARELMESIVRPSPKDRLCIWLPLRTNPELYADTKSSEPFYLPPKPTPVEATPLVEAASLTGSLEKWTLSLRASAPGLARVRRVHLDAVERSAEPAVIAEWRADHKTPRLARTSNPSISNTSEDVELRGIVVPASVSTGESAFSGCWRWCTLTPREHEAYDPEGELRIRVEAAQVGAWFVRLHGAREKRSAPPLVGIRHAVYFPLSGSDDEPEVLLILHGRFAIESNRRELDRSAATWQDWNGPLEKEALGLVWPALYSFVKDDGGEEMLPGLVEAVEKAVGRLGTDLVDALSERWRLSLVLSKGKEEWKLVPADDGHPLLELPHEKALLNHLPGIRELSEYVPIRLRRPLEPEGGSRWPLDRIKTALSKPPIALRDVTIPIVERVCSEWKSQDADLGDVLRDWLQDIFAGMEKENERVSAHVAELLRKHIDPSRVWVWPGPWDTWREVCAVLCWRGAPVLVAPPGLPKWHSQPTPSVAFLPTNDGRQVALRSVLPFDELESLVTLPDDKVWLHDLQDPLPKLLKKHKEYSADAKELAQYVQGEKNLQLGNIAGFDWQRLKAALKPDSWDQVDGLKLLARLDGFHDDILPSLTGEPNSPFLRQLLQRLTAPPTRDEELVKAALTHVCGPEPLSGVFLMTVAGDWRLAEEIGFFDPERPRDSVVAQGWLQTNWESEEKAPGETSSKSFDADGYFRRWLEDRDHSPAIGLFLFLLGLRKDACRHLGPLTEEELKQKLLPNGTRFPEPRTLRELWEWTPGSPTHGELAESLGPSVKKSWFGSNASEPFTETLKEAYRVKFGGTPRRRVVDCQCSSCGWPCHRTTLWRHLCGWVGSVHIRAPGTSTLRSVTGTYIRLADSKVESLLSETPKRGSYVLYLNDISAVQWDAKTRWERLKNAIESLLTKFRGLTSEDGGRFEIPESLWGALTVPEQVALSVAEHRLAEQLPYDLRRLDLTESDNVRKALSEWDRADRDSRGSTGYLHPTEGHEGRAKALKSLVDKCKCREYASELLLSVRKRLDEYQYPVHNVPFELLQNADDATADLIRDDTPHLPVEERWFTLKLGPDQLMVEHHGRRVNQTHVRGSALNEEANFACDLEFMCGWGASSKRGRADVTGKFGLGFKSVYQICDQPKVESGALRFRIVAGLIPEKLSEADVSRGLDLGVTRITLELREKDPQSYEVVREAFERFRRHAPVSLLFARGLNRITIDDKVHAVPRPDAGERWRVIDLGNEPHRRVLQIGSFTGGPSLLLWLDSSNGEVVNPPDGTPALWVFAPTQDPTGRGFCLNAPFQLDVGRNIVAGSEANKQIARSAGSTLAKVLAEMHSKPESLALACATSGADPNVFATAFWMSLWKVLGTSNRYDSSEKGAREVLSLLLWDREAGLLSSLYRDCDALPTGLSGKYQTLTRFRRITHVTRGVLDLEEVDGIFDTVVNAEWLKDYGLAPGEIVSGERVGRALESWRVLLDPQGEKPRFEGLKFLDVLTKQVTNGECTPVIAQYMDDLLDMKLMSKLKSEGESMEFLAWCGGLRFADRDGQWYAASRLNKSDLRPEYGSPRSFFDLCKSQPRAEDSSVDNELGTVPDQPEEMEKWLAKHLTEADLRRIVPPDAHEYVFSNGVDPFKRFTDLSWPDTWRLVRDALRKKGKNVDGDVVPRDQTMQNDVYQDSWTLPPRTERELDPLREYQKTSIHQVREALEVSKGGRALLSLPTGAGKTRIAAELVVDWLGRRDESTARIVWTAPRRELLLNAMDALVAQWRCSPGSRGVRISLETSLETPTRSTEATEGLHVIHLTTRNALAKRFQAKAFDLLVVDEVHHSFGVVERFLGDSSIPRLGISATPIRDRDPNGDGTGALLKLFGDPLPIDSEDSKPRRDAEAKLRDPEFHRLDDTDGGVFEADDDSDGLPRVEVAALVERVANLAPPHDQSIIFARNRMEASAIRWCLAARLGAAAVAIIDARTPRAARDKLFQRFRDGEIRHLINVEVLATGVDFPKVRNVFIARATTSPVLYVQMIGRGRRPGEGACHVFDINYDRRDELLGAFESIRAVSDDAPAAMKTA